MKLGFAILTLVLIVLVTVLSRTANKNVGQATASPKIEKPGAQWVYDSAEDKMTGKPYHTARVATTNIINLNSPYSGPQHPTLTLRQHPRYGNHVILQLQAGQFMAGLHGVDLLARFDESQPVHFALGESGDNDSSVVFILNYAKFVTLTKKAKVVRLSTTVYEAGDQMFEFNVEGLKDF